LKIFELFSQLLEKNQILHHNIAIVAEIWKIFELISDNMMFSEIWLWILEMKKFTSIHNSI
jgi:hypothetical protein